MPAVSPPLPLFPNPLSAAPPAPQAVAHLDKRLQDKVLATAAKIVQKRFLADQELDRKLQQQILQVHPPACRRVCLQGRASSHACRVGRGFPGGSRLAPCEAQEWAHCLDGHDRSSLVLSRAERPLCGLPLSSLPQTAIKVVKRQGAAQAAAAAASPAPEVPAAAAEEVGATPTRRLEFDQVRQGWAGGVLHCLAAA